MINTIASKEITEMMRDGRFRWAASIVLALLLGAMALGWQHYREVAQQHEIARRATRSQWLNQGTKNPHSAAHYGVYAFRPKTPLSLVDQGIDPWMGVTAWLEAHKQNDFKYRPAQDATAVQRFGELTGATVLQLLIPLMIILLAFPAFAAEREQGTLRQVLSLGVDRATLGWGKAVGVAAALGILLVPATVAGVVALSIASENGSFVAGLPRMIFLMASYLMYFVALIALSLAASAYFRSSRIALVALLGFWILNGLVAPRVVADIAKTVYRTPSAFEFGKQVELALRNGVDGHDFADSRAEELKAGLLRKYKVKTLEELPVSYQGIALQAGEEHGNEVFDHFYSELWATFDKQETIHRAAALAAPVLSVRSLSMGFAGTDFAQHAHFAKAAEDYRRRVQRTMNADIAANAKKVIGPYLGGADLWNQVPDFEYTMPSFQWVFARQAFSFCLLTLWTIGAVALARIATMRLRVD